MILLAKGFETVTIVVGTPDNIGGITISVRRNKKNGDIHLSHLKNHQNWHCYRDQICFFIHLDLQGHVINICKVTREPFKKRGQKPRY